MLGRVVVQWDKEDCADLGIIKVNVLGLGMMAVLEEATAIIRSRCGPFDLARIPADDPKTYEVIQQANTVGVFQIESRAKLVTLSRIKPTRLYDLLVEVAIIYPVPITGNMVHPYINRRLGRGPVWYAHPSLPPPLARGGGHSLPPRQTKETYPTPSWRSALWHPSKIKGKRALDRVSVERRNRDRLVPQPELSRRAFYCCQQASRLCVEIEFVVLGNKAGMHCADADRIQPPE